MVSKLGSDFVPLPLYIGWVGDWLELLKAWVAGELVHDARLVLG